VETYTYSSNTFGSGTNLGFSAFGLVGCGTSTLGLFAGGSSGLYNSLVSLYTYSGDSVVAGTSLTSVTYSGGAASNLTTAFIINGSSNSGSSTTGTQTYTYSGNTTAAGTALGVATTSSGVAGNNTFCVIGGINTGVSTFTQNTRTYTFSGATTGAGTNLSKNRVYPYAACSTPGGF
jgi:hypothetical protein